MEIKEIREKIFLNFADSTRIAIIDISVNVRGYTNEKPIQTDEKKMEKERIPNIWKDQKKYK